MHSTSVATFFLLWLCFHCLNDGISFIEKWPQSLLPCNESHPTKTLLMEFPSFDRTWGKVRNNPIEGPQSESFVQMVLLKEFRTPFFNHHQTSLRKQLSLNAYAQQKATLWPQWSTPRLYHCSSLKRESANVAGLCAFFDKSVVHTSRTIALPALPICENHRLLPGKKTKRRCCFQILHEIGSDFYATFPFQCYGWPVHSIISTALLSFLTQLSQWYPCDAQQC